MTQATALLGLLAETSIHAGAGQSVGAIDLPIQREAHNDWPCVYGSAVKGALRARAEGLKLRGLDVIFGPAPDSGRVSEHAGSLMVGDARLLLLPVRSLTSHFRWVTCPAVLWRLKRDAERLEITLGNFEPPKAVTDDEVLLPEGKVDLFLEEYRFTGQSLGLEEIISVLAKLVPDSEAPALLRRQLAIISDNMFGHLARYATPVAAHVCIANETKTVKEGALWYEETLPPETLLYVALGAWDARKAGAEMDAKIVLDGTLSGLFKPAPYLQLGGNETVGMGWCKVATVKGE